MTVERLIEELKRLPKDLEVYASHGSSGSSYEVAFPFSDETSEHDDIESLAELPVGTRVCILPLD